MGISINEIESGMGLMIDGQIFLVQEFNHVKPGKGAAFVRVRVKNLKTLQVLERTFRSSDSLDDIELEERKLQNLYQSADGHHFMDHSTYEEVVIPEEVLGDNIKFLQENMEVLGICYNNKVLKIELPNFIITEIMEADPGLKGDSSRAGTKPVKIDTGATVYAPLFIAKGDWVRIDTRSGEYVERVKK